MACKPGSVHAASEPVAWGDHSSGTCLAACLTRPTRVAGRERPRGRPQSGPPPATPIRPCSRWGLPCRDRCRPRGGLLPHPFTLTRSEPGGLLSVALSLRSPSPDVIRHRVSVEPGLSSPYRLSTLVKRGCPANWPALLSGARFELPPQKSRISVKKAT